MSEENELEIEELKQIDIKNPEDCKYFADEGIPNNVARQVCFSPQGNPKCKLFHQCWSIFTRRR